MTPEDRRKFAAIVTGFAELKGKQLSKGALDLFWGAMQDWSIEDFERAAAYLVRSREFMPTPKDFEDLRKANRVVAGDVWARILSGARCGYTPELDPASARALAAIGGIQSVMMSDSSKTHFLERRFCEHFEAMRESDDRREEVPLLTNSKELTDSIKLLAGRK